MRLIRVLVAIAMAALPFGGRAVAITVIEESSNSFQAGWGGSGFYPNSEYRYAEGRVRIDFTRSLHHPTYLNVVHQYSQASSGCPVNVYIATSMQCPIDQNADPHYHESWWNCGSATPGYYVGQFTCGPSKAVTSFNVETWISSNPADVYYVLFDQLDDACDVSVDMTWLGPEGTTGALTGPNLREPVAGSTWAPVPNPSVRAVSIRYSVSRPGPVSVRILDASGRVTCTLLTSRQVPGSHAVTWDGRDSYGREVPAGTYIFEVTSPGSHTFGKIERE